MPFVKVANVNELEPGQGKVVEAGENTIALFNADGKFFAIDNTCMHMGGPLGEGFLDEHVVTCPWHGWRYDVKTGQSMNIPTIKVKKYNVKVQGSEVFVEV